LCRRLGYTARLLLNDVCRHQALIDVSGYGDDVEVPSFQRRAESGKWGGKRVDVCPNWKEQPVL